MASRVRWGAPGAFARFAGLWLIVGLLASLDNRTVDLAFEALIASVLLAGSAGVLLGMWRARGDSEAVWRTAHRGQLALFPPSWRRWIFGDGRR
jgi:hypothetical protein